MGKVIIVTGGTKGIGRAITLELLKNSDIVYALYKNDEANANKLKESVKSENLFVEKCDVCDNLQISKLFDKIIKKHKTIDALINNAGISLVKTLNDTSYDEWQKVINTNLTSVYNTTKAVYDQMVSQKSGKIINITSMWGEVGASCEVAYSASKAGIIGFTKALSKELGPSNIMVNAVSPGFIDTNMNSHLSKEDIDSIILDTPLERCGTPKDVADVVSFLVSDKASFITGQVIGVNGGLVI